MPVQRRLAAILAADVAGYSRLMGEDEEGTRTRFNDHLAELIEPAIGSRRGRIVKTTGDGLLVEFASVVDAVQCAVEIQQGMAERNADEPDDRRMEFRIGVNIGDVIIEGDDIHGDGVNVAARLEGLADPSSICVSGDVYRQCRGKLDVEFDDLGPQEFKNIAEPVHAYRIATVPSAQMSVDDPLPLPDKPSIAVLPFENMSGDPEQEYFADGIAEDIITALSRFRWFFVIARNSSFTYKGQAVDVTQVSRELGVRYVLEGSVRKVGNRARITAQLIDAATGRHVWAERYDRELHDIFEVQDEITGAITAAVGPLFATAEAQRAERKAPENFDAWDYAMRGNWHFWRLTREDLSEARRLFRAATDLDPKSAIAHSGQSLACMMQLMFAFAKDGEDTRAIAQRAARRAVELDDQDAWAQAAHGFVSTHSREHDLAVNACRRAIDLNPNLAFAEGVLSMAYSQIGDYDNTLIHAQNAARLSPRDPARLLWNLARAAAAFATDRYEESLEWGKTLTEIAPDYPAGWRVRVAACSALDRAEEARTALDRLLGLAPRDNLRLIEAVHPYEPELRARYIDCLRKAGMPEK